MNDILVIVIALLLAFAGLFVIPRIMVRRAVKKVVSIFKQTGTTTIGAARTARELGLEPPSFTQRLMRGRDYKPLALKALVDADIVRATPEGKLYLIEEKLFGTPFAG